MGKSRRQGDESDQWVLEGQGWAEERRENRGAYDGLGGWAEIAQTVSKSTPKLGGEKPNRSFNADSAQPCDSAARRLPENRFQKREDKKNESESESSVVRAHQAPATDNVLAGCNVGCGGCVCPTTAKPHRNVDRQFHRRCATQRLGGQRPNYRYVLAGPKCNYRQSDGSGLELRWKWWSNIGPDYARCEQCLGVFNYVWQHRSRGR